MIKQTFGTAALALACGLALTAAPVNTAHAAQAANGNVNCDLTYNLEGWSAIYKRAEGTGRVSCDNGQSAPVKISVVGGGLTAGKFRVTNGKGQISDVRGISDVYGEYAEASAEAGLVKSARAQVLTKGSTSLALAATGQGVDLGISFGQFTISPL